jgi:hypothetical protein
MNYYTLITLTSMDPEVTVMTEMADDMSTLLDVLIGRYHYVVKSKSDLVKVLKDSRDQKVYKNL